MIIDSKVLECTPLNMPDYSEEQIKNEPMLFNCNLDGAIRLGGPITREVLCQIPAAWAQGPLLIDSRVHMLMPGWYPCIPGWHHDDVPRTREDKQPNYGPGQCRSEHMMLLINGDICPTEFALGEAEFGVPGLGQVIYEHWHRDVETKLVQGELVPWSAPSKTFIHFGDRTWHRGVPAVAGGWRYFIRISRYFDPDGKWIDRGNPRTNELRRQVQVYLESPNKGW